MLAAQRYIFSVKAVVLGYSLRLVLKGVSVPVGGGNGGWKAARTGGLESPPYKRRGRRDKTVDLKLEN
jgi:hypothetical protein